MQEAHKELQTSKEPIATISKASIGRTRIVGRDKRGRLLEETVCARRSIKMIDLDGVEVDIPIQNGRAPTRTSATKYGEPHVRTMIALGFVPKILCPLAGHAAAGGPMLEIAPEGEELVEKDEDGEVTFRGHVSADKCEIDPSAPPKHGCMHYRLLKHRRRNGADAMTRRRKEAARRGDLAAAMQDIAKSFSGRWDQNEQRAMIDASIARGGSLDIPTPGNDEQQPAAPKPSLASFKTASADYAMDVDQRRQLAAMYMAGDEPYAHIWLADNAEFFDLKRRDEPDTEPAKPKRKRRTKKTDPK